MTQKSTQNYFIIFLSDQKPPKIGDIFKVIRIDKDFDSDCKAHLAICYIEPVEKEEDKDES